MAGETYQPAGIEYVRVVGVPTQDSPGRRTRRERGYRMRVEQAGRLGAFAIIRLRVPLRGVEVQYPRRVPRLSQAALGCELGLSDVAVAQVG